MSTLDGFEARKCADCEQSDSRVTDLSPIQRLVIPTEAIVAGAGGGAARPPLQPARRAA